MGYPLQRHMRTPIIVAPDGEKLAFGIADDGMTWNFGLFRNQGGEWLAVPPLIDPNLQQHEIMAHGTVAEWIKAQLPVMNARLREYMAIPKPDQSDKIACAGYDFALDVELVDGQLQLNKDPPLSHAR